MNGATKLQQVRRSLGYSAGTVLELLLRRAEKLNFSIMSPASLKTKLSRWENGHEPVSLPEYRRLFRDIYGRTNEELGFPPDNGDDEAEELLAQLSIARTVDAGMVEVFRQQVEQLAEARALAKHEAPELLASWLVAAHGEGLAAAGHRDEALRAFDAAGSLLPADPVDPSLPFLFLAGAHLDRWRGHALSRLGEPDAVNQITDALPRLPAEFTRSRTSMLVDLAYAHAAAGDRDAALQHAREAKRLAMQIKSDRQLRRLGGLILPTGGTGAA